MPYEEEHADPQGPGDARPTAMQIVNDQGLQGKLDDRVAIVTGASSGIGVETARALYANGATVYMPARNLEKGKKAAEDIKGTSTRTPGKLEVMEMDLDSLESVKKFAQAFLEKESKLNLLINNAGVTLHEVQSVLQTVLQSSRARGMLKSLSCMWRTCTAWSTHTCTKHAGHIFSSFYYLSFWHGMNLDVLVLLGFPPR